MKWVSGVSVVFLASVLAVLPAAADPAQTPLAKAYAFLYARMDAYQQGSALRLVQSYVPTPAFTTGDTSFTYDDAVTIIALLKRGNSTDIARAMILGDSLIYAQAHDPFADGRVRDAYRAQRFIRSDGSPAIAAGNMGSHTGNMAWTGIAFLQLYHATGQQRYLTAAEAIGGFIRQTAYDTRGAGGFSGGFVQGQKKIAYKSTEHNLDLYGFFTMLAAAADDPAWSADAQHALRFVNTMWNKTDGYFYIGSGNDGVTINTGDPTPEDVQTWSYLSLQLKRYRHSVDWALDNLFATTGGFDGLSFEANDRTGVWFEGTAHAAEALKARHFTGDAAAATLLLKDVETGQVSAPNADGRGIVAASKDGLESDDAGGEYFAALHIGATAWYCLAKQGGNPFRFLAAP